MGQIFEPITEGFDQCELHLSGGVKRGQTVIRFQDEPSPDQSITTYQLKTSYYNLRCNFERI